MPANELSFNQISAEMNAIHAQAIGAQPPRAINTGAVMTQAQAALLGADVQLVPLTVTENDTYNPPAGKGFGTVTVNVPNPNSVETITGTLANPWGEKTPVNLFSGAKSGDLTMLMDVDATAIGGATFHVVFYPFGTTNGFGLFVASSQLSNSVGVFAEYADSGVMEVAYGLQNGSILDYSPYASTISTTLTIIYHPLPTSTEDET